MPEATEGKSTSDRSLKVDRTVSQKPVKLIQSVYENNLKSGYTETIHELDKKFDYDSNSDKYWSEPQQSLLYGTPLYEASSSSQKLALNHLYWATQYSKIATDEITALIFNPMTGSVFSKFQDLGTLCQELDLETEQERYHIHAFQRISRLTKKALKCDRLKQSTVKKSSILDNKHNYFSKHDSFVARFEIERSLRKSSYSSLRFINKFLLETQEKEPCKFLQELEQQKEGVQIPVNGVFSKFPFRYQTMQLLTINFGTSPFLASTYYAIRLIANMMLKNWEYNYVQYFRQLEKNGEFIPAPTSVSYWHFLDESFHTTISKTISLDVYKLFSKPTAYEQFIANMSYYAMQRNLKGLSGAVPYRFIEDDPSFLDFIYQILQTPVFNMSASEALYWLEKCFCQEHEGFHLTLNHHQRLLSNLRQTFADVDYLWPVNREMRLVSSGASISRSVHHNIKAFKRFSQSVA
ncbi:hypothetical protein NUACC21_80090 [Scytonema sp. NUACC21]